MAQDRLTNLAIMSIESRVDYKTDVIIKKFAILIDRKIEFFVWKCLKRVLERKLLNKKISNLKTKFYFCCLQYC